MTSTTTSPETATTDSAASTVDPVDSPELQARTSDLRVRALDALPAPRAMLADLPLGATRSDLVTTSRREVRDVLAGDDDRLLVIVGPCSVHDPEAALEYAGRLAAVAHELADDLMVVMRVYFEKPRTTVGWKGLINDPHLDGTHDIETGLRQARGFLRDVTALGMPCATEFLEPISPQYTADLITWGAIGARTTESQIHRQLASGLSMPIGFKNGMDGGLQVALDAAAAASAPQAFLGIGADGRASLVSTTGNPDTSIILRGGADGPNYDAAHVREAARRLDAAALAPRVIIDASHGNSGKDHIRQAEVAAELAEQIAADGAAIAGVMLESNLVPGAQKLDVSSRNRLTYGQSVTDACMGWDATTSVLADLAAGVRRRRG